ncbi:type II secretion system protein [Patescibacteria group bacterium]|nr:type II secretion system protein [Patescibacteria group bacterium]
MFKRFASGFTLIELMIVIALIALLGASVLVAVDPARRIGEARNAVRASDAESIKNALDYYVGEYHSLPVALASKADNTNYMIAAAGDTSGSTVSCEAVGDIVKVDITNGASNLFNFIPTIPIDPEQSSPYTNGSGYYCKKQGNKIIDIKPCNVYTAPVEEVVVVPVCGNGVVEGAEVCDAGVNNRSTNVCAMSPDCQANNSSCSSGFYCRTDCTTCVQCTASCSG